MKPLWKTTIVIWSDYPGTSIELEDLARDAASGEAYCSAAKSVEIAEPTTDPDWDGNEFFEPADGEDE